MINVKLGDFVQLKQSRNPYVSIRDVLEVIAIERVSQTQQERLTLELKGNTYHTYSDNIAQIVKPKEVVTFT